MFHKENHKGGRKGGYIFTVRKHPEKGIMSTILGVLSLISIGAAVYLTYSHGGSAKPQYGAAVFLVTLFSLAGLVLGILSRIEKDNYYLFPHLGIGLNVLSLGAVSFILYAGIG
ncbi:MAG: hypothetical protein K2P19_06535 [Kineothrix sp.]|nr:hypothetical protein [Kineothrix sp.]NBI89533.1 hypothetical protein [Lachnospiraceae bacterium]